MGVFHNLKVSRVQRGIDTCEVQLINPDSGQQSAIVYNAPLVVMINDRVEFSGRIKRIEKNDNINVWDIFAQNAVADLRDLSSPTTITYSHYQPYYIISDALPATTWTPMQFTGFGDYMDYTVTPGQSALTTCENVCNQQGWVWSVRQHTQSCSITDYSTTGITIDYTPDPADYWENWYGVVRSGQGICTQFRVTAASGADLTLNYVPSGIATGDYVYLMGKYWFEFGTRIGSSTTATVEHYTINSDSCWLNRKQNVDKIFTSVVAVGQNPEVSRVTAWATACTDNYHKLVSNESYLVLPIDDDDITIYPAFAGYLPANGRVQIGDEKIDYTNKTATSLTGVTRGADSTTAASHYPFDSVMYVNELEFDETTNFQSSGGIWLGSEYITYTSKDTTKIYTLTRGASDTTPYHHYQGTYGFDGTYSNDGPEAGSPVALYGVRRKVIECVGATTRDALDKRAQQYLLSNMNNTEYGDFTLLSHDFWQDIRIGDYVKVTDANSDDHEWQIVGVDYDQFRPVKVYFGQSDDYILEDIARIEGSYDVGREKAQLTRTSTILELSNDETWARVKYDDDGSVEWIQLA